MTVSYCSESRSINSLAWAWRKRRDIVDQSTRFRFPELYVFTDGIRKEKDILHDDEKYCCEAASGTDRGCRLVQIESYRRGVVKPLQKLDDGGFSGAGRAHDTDAFPPASTVEGNVMKDLMSVLLMERDVVKLDFSLNAREAFRDAPAP